MPRSTTIDMAKMDYVHELKRLGEGRRGTPVNQPSIEDWRHLEADLDLTLPTDYKELVSWFGAGGFGSSIGLRNPCEPSGNCSLSRSTFLCWDEVVDYFPEERQLLYYSWGGDLFYMGSAGDGMEFDYVLDREDKRLKDPQVYSAWLDVVYPIESVSRYIYEVYTGQLEHLMPGIQKSQWKEPAPFFRPSTYPDDPA